MEWQLIDNKGCPTGCDVHLPLQETLPVEHGTVLANAILRMKEVAEHPADDVVAAFSNYI